MLRCGVFVRAICISACPEDVQHTNSDAIPIDHRLAAAYCRSGPRFVGRTGLITHGVVNIVRGLSESGDANCAGSRSATGCRLAVGASVSYGPVLPLSG